MLDLRWIRENPEEFDQRMATRGQEAVSKQIIDLDAKRRDLQTELQTLQQKRNDFSKRMGQVKREGGDISELQKEGAEIKERIPAVESEEQAVADELKGIMDTLPNLPGPDVPIGEDEEANVLKRSYGDIPAFSFKPKEHYELGEALGLMDFKTAANMSGARFVLLKGALSRLERALSQFMLDLHTEELGYTEVTPPLMVRTDAMYMSGQLPKFAEDAFHTTSDHWLLPTSEVALVNIGAKKVFNEAELPLRYTALTPCFRSEAGSAGRDTTGMLRQHQFNKVELVSLVHPDESETEHERMTTAAEEVLKRLEIPYRVMTLSTGDMGFCARKTYDIEAWLPGQDTFREISSCSNCWDFQARRMAGRFKDPKNEKSKPQFLHTLNGSGIAVGRALIAVMENYQQADGSISVPKVLQPYMNGLEVIKKV